MLLTLFAAALSILTAITALAVLYGRSKIIVDGEAFTAQVQKLIVAGNIDRAIKLCNHGRASPLPRGVKGMLLRANRPYSLEMVYQEALAELEMVRTMRQTTLARILTGLLSGAIMAAILWIHPETPTWCAGLYLVSTVVLHSTSNNIVRHMRMWPGYLMKVRNLLYTQANYLPPPQPQASRDG